MFRNQVRWLEGEEMVEVMAIFKGFCDLPSVHGVINMTQIHITKTKGTFVGDFFLSNPSHTTCNYKLLLTTKRSSQISLWACPTP